MQFGFFLIKQADITYFSQDHQLTDIGSDEAGKENLTDLTNPDLMTEHIDRHIENSEDIEHPIKIPKSLSLEYVRNKEMIELTERNVKYVIL